MTAALSKLSPAPQAPVDWDRWVPIDEAARRLGITEGQLRRKAAGELAARGLALKHRPPAGGNERWFIGRAYDLRLAPGSVGAQYQTPDLSSYTMVQRETAFKRVRCVEIFREARASRPGLMKDWIQDLVVELRARFPRLRISRGTLYRWDSDYQTPADLPKLIDFRGGDQRSRGDRSAWGYFESIYLDDRQPKIRDCWLRTKQHAQAAGLAWCSYKSCVRQLDERIEPEKQLMHRDPRKWRSTCAPYAQQDPERFAAGQCWVGDHRPLDVLVRFPNGSIGRPYITAWLDWRTRRVYADVFESPNSSTILSVLRHGIMDQASMGGPSIVWIDNGKDYSSYTLHGSTKRERRFRFELDETTHKGVFGMLGIEAHFSLAYNPQGKGRMERWFALVADRFDRTFPTYTGKSPERKPESLADIRDHQVPAFEHVRDRFRRFVAGYNADADRTIEDLVDADGTRLSPDEAMRRWCPVVRRLADPAALELCLMQFHKPVRVGRNGVRITVAGVPLTFGQCNPDLSRFKASKRLVHVAFDPQDLSHVKVYDEAWSYITDAAINDTGGVHGDPANRQHVATIARRQAAYKKSLKVTAESYELEYLSNEELLAAEAARSAPTQAAADVPAMKIVQTPLDGQSSGRQKQRVRKAAGAESSSPPREPVGRSIQPLSRIAEFGDFTFTPQDDEDPATQGLDGLRDLIGSVDGDEPADGSPWGQYEGGEP